MAEKKAVKKTSTKKKSAVKASRPANAKPENYFILITGMPLKNLKELANSLENMNDWVFQHHVNETRNDFSAWIKDVLKEEMLAEEIKGARGKAEIEMKIFKHLVNKYL